MRSFTPSAKHAASFTAGLLLLVCIPFAHTDAQPGPGVQWRTIEAHPWKPGWGHEFVWDQDTSTPGYTPVPLTTIQGQGQHESGEDWWYAHKNLYDDHGQHIGYATVGYASFQNIGAIDGTNCFSTVIAGLPVPSQFERFHQRKGEPRGWLARYDLEGKMVWCRTYFLGELFAVAQDEDGAIVITGYASSNRMATAPVSGQGSDYDPGIGQPVDIGGLDCGQIGPMKRKLVVIKVSLTGDLQWAHFYGPEDDLADQWEHTSVGHAVSPIRINGSPALVVAGRASSATSNAEFPFLMRLQPDGTIIDRHHFLPQDPAMQALGVNAASASAVALDVIEHQGMWRAVVAGMYPSNSVNKDFLWHFPDLASTTPYQVSDAWISDQLPQQTATLQASTSGVFFALDGPEPAIIWPVLSNYVPGTNTFSGRSIAELIVHRMVPGDSSPLWSTSLGEVRAYDLQADGVRTADGNLAVVSSKWQPPYSSDEPFGFYQLPSAVQDQLVDPVNGFGYAGTNGAINWPQSDLFDYWMTDAFVTKLDVGNGSIRWTTTFDSDPQGLASPFPGNMKKQECVYKITEASDGGLVICGNTGDNFDDAYLVKLHGECQSARTYDLPLSNDATHVLGAQTLWDQDMELSGQIVVPPGAVLTVDGATIRFADSEQIDHPTRLLVAQGALLVLRNGAHLTSLSDCPGMWDGILLQGDPGLPQGIGTPTPHQAMLDAKEATISNARTAVLVANDIPLAFTQAALLPVASGGVVSAKGTHFVNNVRDVVFSPYENHWNDDPRDIRGNRSRFQQCSFTTQGPLVNAGLTPQQHNLLTGVRGIGYSGCVFANGAPLSIYTHPKELGIGIDAVNATFAVNAYCTGGIPAPGDPCPPQHTQRSAFEGLFYGVRAIAFDPSRTLLLQDADLVQCNYGLRMEGLQDPDITGCHFLPAEPALNALAVPNPYGIYSDQCTGYRIQENVFMAGNSSLVKKLGLIIKDSGPAPNTFYNNTFDNLHTGSIIQGNNATAIDLIGLEVKCNDYGLALPNDFDVAMTGGDVRVQRTQGQPITIIGDPAQLVNPAGNRFSLAHNGSVHPEEDWHVQVSATVVEYFHHVPVPNSRTRPDIASMPDEIIPIEQPTVWPEKQIACPSLLDDERTREERRLMAEAEDDELGNAKGAYDATKDNGDTYTLLGYVSDAAHSSAQVRNALQSVAPRVSAEVWVAAFERTVPMSAWHITQALLSNSPLQAEVLRMVEHYALPSTYADLVYAAQDGEVNVLTLLQSSMAKHAGRKAEAIADLGRMAWLDSLDLGEQLDSLVLLHQQLPAWNSPLAVCGVLAAKGEHGPLLALAQQAGSDHETPALYALLEHYAQAQQAGGWADAASTNLAWLQQLGAQREVIGSAYANAWLHALGHDLPEEIIILPGDGPRSVATSRAPAPISWAADLLLEAYPNPSSGVLFLVYEVPDGSPPGQLRLLDLHGRTLLHKTTAPGPGMMQWNVQGLTPGLYLAELRVQGLPPQQVKVAVQH